MELRMEYLTKALETMEAAVESGTTDPYTYPGADWMVFLSEANRRHLINEHAKTVFERKEAGIHSRHPAL
jgi:hypothetical protein